MASKAKTSKSPTREKTPVKEGFESKEWIEYLKVNPEHELHRKWYSCGEAFAGIYFGIIVRMYDGPFKAFENERNSSKLIKPKSIKYGEFWIDWVRDTESKKHAEFAKWLMTTSDPDAIIWQNRLQFATDYKALVACIENQDIDMRLYLLHYSKMYNRYIKKGGSIDIRLADILDEHDMEDLEDDHKSKKEAIAIAKIPATKKET